MVVMLAAVSYGQECPAGCVSIEDLTEECVPALPDVCPLQAMPSRANAVSWLNDDGSWGSSASGIWLAEPYSVVSPYVVGDFVYPMIGEGTSSTDAEWSCGIRSDGTLDCFGYDTIVAHPSGEEPYSALSSGSTGRYAVLNDMGEIRVWGNTAGAFGSPPTTAGFAELGVGRDNACAVGIANGGVSCWGSTSALVSHASRPTTGTYTSVEVGRYVAGAVQDDGTLDLWCTGYSGCADFLANAPVAGLRGIPSGVSIVSWETGETGELFGAALLSDGSAYLWTGVGVVNPDGVHHSPGFDDYGTPSLRYYIPQGPDGAVTWRSRIEVSATSTGGRMCGVIDDPNGVVDGSSGLVPYVFGEVICWGGSNAGSWPARYAECVPQP